MSKSKVSSFAKLDPAHVLDGLFVPITKTGEALYKVEGTFKGGVIKFEGVQLDVKHQSVLLAIMARGARAGKDKVVIDGSATDLQARQARLSLSVDGSAQESKMGSVKCTAYALLKDAGMEDSKKGYADLKKILTQLATVKLYRSANGHWGVSSIIGNVGGDDDGNLIVTINWRLAGALTGGQNVHVSLNERHALSSSPVAKILHTWLSAYIRPGGQLMAGRGAEVDTLIRHVWGNRPCSDGVMKQRRMRIREALDHISRLEGWTARVDGTHAHISRPKLVGDTFESPGDFAEYLDDVFGVPSR